MSLLRPLNTLLMQRSTLIFGNSALSATDVVKLRQMCEMRSIATDNPGRLSVCLRSVSHATLTVQTGTELIWVLPVGDSWIFVLTKNLDFSTDSMRPLSS